jgi:hypothetical protein
MPGPDVHGPIDALIIEFPSGKAGDATAGALRDLVERGTVRLYDLMVVSNGADGECREIPIEPGSPVETLMPLAGCRSGLLGADDVEDVAGALEPGTIAITLLYENAWAVPFVAAAREEGAQLVASSRLTAQEIMDALDVVEAAG